MVITITVISFEKLYSLKLKLAVMPKNITGNKKECENPPAFSQNSIEGNLYFLSINPIIINAITGKTEVAISWKYVLNFNYYLI